MIQANNLVMIQSVMAHPGKPDAMVSN